MNLEELGRRLAPLAQISRDAREIGYFTGAHDMSTAIAAAVEAAVASCRTPPGDTPMYLIFRDGTCRVYCDWADVAAAVGVGDGLDEWMRTSKDGQIISFRGLGASVMRVRADWIEP